MHLLDQKGSTLTNTSAQANHLQLMINFCRTVVRSDNELLQAAICQYRQSLAAQGQL